MNNWLYTYTLEGKCYKSMWKYNIIWEKTQPTGFLNAKKMPLRNHEDICIFYKKPPTYNPQKTTGHTRKVSKAEHKVGCKNTYFYEQHEIRKKLWQWNKENTGTTKQIQRKNRFL